MRHDHNHIHAVILDWAGTTIDHGSLAPAGAFCALFKIFGVDVTMDEARAPMGMHKRDHIAAMLAMGSIRDQWTGRRGGPPDEADLDQLFDTFIPMQLKALPRFLDVIEGVPGMAAALRERGIRLGATTGYNEAMMDLCLDAGRKQGYAPDVSIAASQVPAGRPAPWMALQAARDLGVYPLWTIVKVGDTVADIGEGLNAGMWTVGVTRTGNEVGLSLAECQAMEAAELRGRIRDADRKLRNAGAHYVIESAADLMPVLELIEARLALGERP